MTITITTHTDYECCGCKFKASKNELLVVADFWEDADRAADKKPLAGFGNNTFGKFSSQSQLAIVEKMKQEYGETVANTGVVLLSLPKLVMRFTIGKQHK